MRRACRSAWIILLGWGASLVVLLALTLVAVVTLGQGVERAGRIAANLWGRTLLAACGIRLVVEGGEHLAGRRARIVVFNHASMLDAFLMTAVFPPGGVAVVKREILFYPFVGQAVWLLGYVALNRGKPRRAYATLIRAAARVARRRQSVFISPEGTRSADGSVGRFKLGAFRLAMAVRAPIVPVAVLGAFELLGKGGLSPRPGVVRLRILPPIAADDFVEENLAEKAAFVRSLIERELTRG